MIKFFEEVYLAPDGDGWQHVITGMAIIGERRLRNVVSMRDDRKILPREEAKIFRRLARTQLRHWYAEMEADPARY